MDNYGGVFSELGEPVAYIPTDTGLRAVPDDAPRLNDNTPPPEDPGVPKPGTRPPSRGTKVFGFLILAVILIMATSIVSFGVRLGWLLAEGLAG